MKHKVKTRDASKVRDWLANRGGILLWGCLDLASPGTQWTTPRFDDQGAPTQKPHWAASQQPERVITDEADVVVIVQKLVKRFRVAIRPCRGGMAFKCTDASSRRINAAVDKASKDGTVEAWHEFDYGTQEALIFAADREVPLPEYRE